MPTEKFNELSYIIFKSLEVNKINSEILEKKIFDVINVYPSEKDEEYIIEKTTFLLCNLLKSVKDYDNLKDYLTTFLYNNKESK